MRHKCGIYLRVSTEEQAQVVEGSISSQKHRLMSYVDIKNVQEPGWGKVIEIYADEGLSAKDTRRPAFQKMMTDIRKGKINLILVADISRLSRNILDFCILLDDLKKHNAKFLSIKEQFDTSTPVGELMVFNMISLAQFERKQTAERVSLNFHSRALRGLLNGGPVILGYDKDPKSPCSYAVNEREADDVRKIFEMYLEEGTISKTLKRINAEEIPRKASGRKANRLANAGLWDISALKRLLANPAYVGLREINEKFKNHDEYELKAFQKYQIVKASWPAIVSQGLFDDVQSALAKAYGHERVRLKDAEKRVFFLSGILRCPECGAPYVGEAGHGRKEVYRYYVHKHYVGKSFGCRVKRFPAGLVEGKVIEHLNTFLQQQGYLEGIEENIQSGVGDRLTRAKESRRKVFAEIARVESEIMGVFRVLSTMSEGPGLELAKSKLNELGQKKAELDSKKVEAEDSLSSLEEKARISEPVRGKILAFPKLWSKGTPAEQKRLLRTIFKHLLPTEKSLQVFYWLNESDDEQKNPRNKKRDPESTSASLVHLSTFPPVLPFAGIPAIGLNGVKDGT
jgi:site-specific DNA recombinase